MSNHQQTRYNVFKLKSRVKMKRRIVGIVGVLLLSSGLFAKDNIFLGAEFGFGNTYYEDESSRNDSQHIYTSYKIGKYFDEYRLSMSLSNSNNIAINADYLFPQEDSKFIPYVGTGVGYYYKSSYNSKNYTYESTHTTSVITLGLNAGTTYEINNNFELDGSCGLSHSSGTQDISATSFSCSVGINYLFSK